jgi:hypothetical protein
MKDLFITPYEAAVLRAIATNCFNVMNYGVPTCYEDANAEIWTDSINDAKYPSGLEGKALSGVCSSLAKKGLVEKSFSETIVLTEEGFNAYVAFYK